MAKARCIHGQIWYQFCWECGDRFPMVAAKVDWIDSFLNDASFHARICHTINTLEIAKSGLEIAKWRPHD